MNGAKWLSLVIWGTPVMTQKLLMEQLATFVVENPNPNWIDQWFFVRYWDSLPQFRFRILVSPSQSESIKKQLKERLATYLRAHQLWKLEWVAYRPEPERYGRDNMAIVEKLFHIQSQWAVQLFKERFSEEERLRHLLQIVPYLLNTVSSKPLEIASIIKEQHQFFKNRLNVDERSSKAISKAYRKMEGYIHVDKDPKSMGTVLVNGMIKTMEQVKYTDSTKIQRSRDMLHMLVNKCFLTDHTQWEFLLYEFLDRAYRSYLARPYS